jgi:glycosyltransferase involved in cell wall biosynthesis
MGMTGVVGRRPRIAFVSSFDLEAIQSWSWAGTFRGMIHGLQAHCGDVEYVGPLRCVEQQLARIRSKASQVIFHKEFIRYHCRLVSKPYGRQLARRLKGVPYDLIVAPAGETEIAYLQTSLPIVLVEDAPYGALIDYYDAYSNLSNRSINDLHTLERRALAKAAAVVASTSWAARSVIADYGTNPAKVHVVPFGANFETIPDRDLVLAPRPGDPLRLLFVGGPWYRKGGDIALEALDRLLQLGIDAELTVVGCTPPAGVHHQRLRVVPFLDKSVDRERDELERLYRTSHFLLLPTRNEAYGIVFCEASAYALPVVSTDTGGVSGVVRHDETGFLLPQHARGDAYADALASIYRDRARYRSMVLASREAFEARLNWDSWGRSVSQIIAGIRQPRSEPASSSVSAVRR